MGTIYPSPPEQKMVKKCYVPTCTNTSLTNPHHIFILVPLDHTRRVAWFEAVGLKYVPKGSRIYCCEDHFNFEEDAENWMAFKTIQQRLILKKHVVPHMFIASPKPTMRRESQLTSSAKKRKAEVLKKVEEAEPVKRRLRFDTPGTSKESSELEPPQLSYSPSRSGCVARAEFSIAVPNWQTRATQTEVKLTSVKTQTEDILISPVQKMVCADPCDSDGSTVISSSATILSTSGSTKSSEWSVKISKNKKFQEAHRLLLRTKSRFYLGLPADTYFIIDLLEKKSQLCHRDILICLKKIRMGDVNARLGDDFGLSSSQIGRIFNGGVPVLAKFMKELIVWQDSEYIEVHLPIPFRYRYKNVQGIIDCFEIEIEAPSDALKQSLTWSDYKKCNTIKYMVSATPHGIINFVSNGYGGRSSDKIIMETSSFLNVIPQNCQLMADRGFKGVAQLLATKNCTLIRPPSVIEGQLPDKEAARETRRIAALRIHIERAIRRLREFALLKRHACINTNLLYLYDCIVIIAAGIVNLQGALIK